MENLETYTVYVKKQNNGEQACVFYCLAQKIML